MGQLSHIGLVHHFQFTDQLPALLVRQCRCQAQNGPGRPRQ